MSRSIWIYEFTIALPVRLLKFYSDRLHNFFFHCPLGITLRVSSRLRHRLQHIFLDRFLFIFRGLWPNDEYEQQTKPEFVKLLESYQIVKVNALHFDCSARNSLSILVLSYPTHRVKIALQCNSLNESF